MQCYAVNSDQANCKTAVHGREAARHLSPPVELYVVWDFYEEDKLVDSAPKMYDLMWAALKRDGKRGRDGLIQNYIHNDNSVDGFDKITDDDLNWFERLYETILTSFSAKLAAPLNRDPRVRCRPLQTSLQRRRSTADTRLL